MRRILRVFKKRVNKGGNGISLILLGSMFVLLFLSMPDFLLSTAGRIFVGVWMLLAGAAFLAYSSSFKERRAQGFVASKKKGRTTRVRPVLYKEDYREREPNTSSRLFSR